ncbi:hypothetical protein [Muriicola sp. Z0-33]|uniref:hypothetical protein n=1 Tax=Muriicola sp. Z0-33 TaxID=2816957 RepID=UPI00223807ED|nr:hypothetical protein [Muriicola sp. Z0-33]MCW5516344.1 hypothetical protein [Muriicola sp. Z0-33]
MNIRKLFCGVLCLATLLGCSRDDAAEFEEPISNVPDFRVVGEDIENIYQFNYTASGETGELINLTQENNVALQYLELSQVNDLLTFYSFSAGSFSAVQRNAVTGVNNQLNNFYTVSEERSILWGANSESKLFLGFFSPQGSTNFGVRTIDIATDEVTDINIAFNVNIVFQAIYSNGKLILTYRDNLNSNKVAIINTQTNSLMRTIDFGPATTSIFIDDQGDIVIILSEGDENQEYQLYDFDTLDLKEQQAFLLDRLFAPGPLDASISDTKLFYIYSYSQPSPVLAAPAIYDFVNQENKIIDMIGIARQVEEDLEANIVLSAIAYKKEADVFLVGYGKQDGNILEGGVLIISSKGQLVDNINLPFAPTYIVE